ncbi:MAG: radical SAM protein [Oscillospiraceae bacterium]|nr:radical SAM protein [Oscillospiraceae bacterium]
MNNQWSDIRRSLTHRCAGLGIPVSGTFELTPRCNLRCRMCYVRLTPEQMAPIGQERTAQQWLEMAQWAKDAGMAFLLLTGGEPTLRQDFCEIYEGMAQMGLSISINTNGTLLTPELRALWHRLPPAQVNVTLYGTDREDYEALCGNGEAYDAVVDGLDWLQQEGILVHLNTTMVPSNAAKWQQLEQVAQQRKLELRMTAYCFPPNRRDQSCFQRLEPEEAGRLIVKDILFREGPEGVLEKARSLTTPLPRSCELDNGEPILCMAGRAQFWITWNGSMAPCAMLTQPTADPYEAGFEAAWQQLRQLCAPIRLCPDCVSCPEAKTCLNCAAVTLAETGRFDGKPEYMCRLNRAYRQELCALAETLE